MSERKRRASHRRIAEIRAALSWAITGWFHSPDADAGWEQDTERGKSGANGRSNRTGAETNRRHTARKSSPGGVS
jgi:hypothetical protein